MNARQRKKQFKKLYGYNPSKSIKREEIINAFELMGRTIDMAVVAINKFFEAANNVVKNIKEMPEDEFNDKLEHSDLTNDQIAMAKLIRYGREKKG